MPTSDGVVEGERRGTRGGSVLVMSVSCMSGTAAIADRKRLFVPNQASSVSRYAMTSLSLVCAWLYAPTLRRLICWHPTTFIPLMR